MITKNMTNWTSETNKDKDNGDTATTSSDGSKNQNTLDNTIYFNDYVTMETISYLNQNLRRIDKELASASVKYDIPQPPIHLRIQSYGGDLLGAFGAIDCMNQIKSDVWTYIDGSAASAGTLLSVVGKKRFIGKNSYMLIHQLSAWHIGKYSELKDEMESTELIMEHIRDIYRQHTKIPKCDLDKILSHDLWWNAEKCLDYGLVDEII